MNEKDLSAEQDKARAQAWLSGAHGHSWRTRHYPQTPQERPQTFGAEGIKIRPQGFPPERRIRKRRDFMAVYASGKKIHSAHYILFAFWQPGEPQRLGIAASRKIGNAVQRNRIKRVLREVFRTAAFGLPGCQLVAVAKKGAHELTFAQAASELLPLLRRLGRMS